MTSWLEPLNLSKSKQRWPKSRVLGDYEWHDWSDGLIQSNYDWVSDTESGHTVDIIGWSLLVSKNTKDCRFFETTRKTQKIVEKCPGLSSIVYLLHVCEDNTIVQFAQLINKMFSWSRMVWQKTSVLDWKLTDYWVSAGKCVVWSKCEGESYNTLSWCIERWPFLHHDLTRHTWYTYVLLFFVTSLCVFPTSSRIRSDHYTSELHHYQLSAKKCVCYTKDYDYYNDCGLGDADECKRMTQMWHTS